MVPRVSQCCLCKKTGELSYVRAGVCVECNEHIELVDGGGAGRPSVLRVLGVLAIGVGVIGVVWAGAAIIRIMVNVAEHGWQFPS